jgi:hypothetical protein
MLQRKRAKCPGTMPMRCAYALGASLGGNSSPRSR